MSQFNRRRFSHNASRQSRARRLNLECMEARELMAAHVGAFNEEVSFSTAEIAAPVLSSSRSQMNAVNDRTTDAGSRLTTALELGRIDGVSSTPGRVSFRDRLDVFEFEIARDGDVQIELTGLRRNADLILANDAGQFIESSRVAGSAAENIQLELQAGSYFVGIQSRSFWGTNYQLDVSANLEQPQDDPAQPFSEVSYFGGSREWNVNAVAAPEAWAAGFTGNGITVAVVDTGVDVDHPDLVSNLFVNPGEIAGNGIDDDGNGYVDDVTGFDFADWDADPNDVNGHGTHVAGTIAAANNGFGATGIAPDATIIPVRVLGDNGSGSSNAVAAGIRYAADLGADIINLSLGGGYSRAIDAAINYARGVGSFIVAAAGNESSSVPGFPARFSATDDNVLSVGAFSSSGRIAGFSNDVGISGSVQIDAPGVGIFSTYVGGRYATLSGTSMASPHVAGVAALTLSANPNLTPAQLRELLVGGVVGRANGSDAVGRLNAATTVAYASRGFRSSPVVPLVANGESSLASSRRASVYRTISFGESPSDVTSPTTDNRLLDIVFASESSESPRDDDEWTWIETLANTYESSLT